MGRALLFALAFTGAQAQLSTCDYLDDDGCCGLACQNLICQSLYSSGKLLGAIKARAWINRTGWDSLYSNNEPADMACQQYLSGTAAATAAAKQPPYCLWHGVMCNSTAYSMCSQPRWAYGVSNITIANNNLSGLINDEFATSIKQLHDCGLHTLVLGGASFDLHGTISPLFGQLTQLRTLGVFGTNVTGVIPTELGNMTFLEVLDLNTNYLVGTIPPELGRLNNLQRLNLGYNGWSDRGKDLTGTFPVEWLRLTNLEIMMLDQNGLHGTLPDNMCSKLTKLSAVSFGNNRFSGPVGQFGNCFSLTALDLSDNNFTGPVPLPTGSAWARLQNLRLNNNNFTGPLPSFDIGQAPQLSYMLLSNNSLTGTIPVSWTYLPFLTVVEASFNYLSGEVPWQLAFQSRLWVLALDNNPDLTGAIDSRWRFSVGLSSLRLHNTDITGPLPGISRRDFASMTNKQGVCGSDASGLGRLPLLHDVSIYNTNMTAKCTSDANGTCQHIEDALPWYLNLDYSAWQIPLPEEGFASNENMQCPTVIQEQYCYRVGAPIPFNSDIRPHWDVSPSYYHYLGCQCQAGFIEHRVNVWHDDVLIAELRCEKALTPSQIAGISVAVSAVALALLAYLAYVSWYGRFGLPKLRRAYADVKKRLVGAPTSGRISVVVTDVEGYSALMVAMPLVMGRAMSQHNNAGRKAAWTHFGFIVGQEGDSYILAFSDALDAVAFCLQFQQALKRTDWPQELLQHLQHQEAEALGLTVAPWASTASPHSPHSLGRSTTHEAKGKNVSATGCSAAGTGYGLPGADLVHTPGDEGLVIAAGPTRESSRFWSAMSRPHRSSHSGSAAGSRASPSPMPLTDTPNSQPRHLCSLSTLHSTDASTAASQDTPPSLEEQRLQQQQQRVATATSLVPGLRVRMGIASGTLLDKEHDLLTCRVLEVARVVSDAAMGGQVLMDGNTFRAVKDRLEELGQVGHSGYSRSNRVTGWGTPRGWLAKLVARHSRSLTAEAQVLDMGMYTVPGFKYSTAKDAAAMLPPLPQLAGEAAARQQAAKDPAIVAGTERANQPTGATTMALSQPAAATRVVVDNGQQVQKAALAAVAAPGEASPLVPVLPSVTLQPVPGADSGASPCSCIRLYQVLAPRLVDRAHLFGNKLSLKDGSRCHDLPYFSAPAAASRPTLDADLQQQPLLASEIRRLSTSGSGVVGDSAHHGHKFAAAAGAPFAAGQSAPSTDYMSNAWQGRRQGDQQQQQQQASWLVPQPSPHRHQGWSGGDGCTTAAGPLHVVAAARPVADDDAVTFVFCSVVMPRAKLSMDTKPKMTAQVSNIVGKVIRECIMAFARSPTTSSSSTPGQRAEGYLCRDLGGDMKYMLAFQNPRVALEWCLLVQEVLLWQAWPASLLEKPAKSNDISEQPPQVLGRRASMVIPTSAAAAAAAAHVGQPFWGIGIGVMHASPPACAQSGFGSQPLFRGPRLKMGVCSGSPQAVTPDHQGRADYHGNAVNMAARFEAICAQGGQIVCEASLAEAVVAEWIATQQAAAAVSTALGQVTDTTADEPRSVPAAARVAHNLRQAVQDEGIPAGARLAQQPSGSAAPGAVSPFLVASRSTLQQQAPAAMLASFTAAASIGSLGAGASFPGPWSMGSSPGHATSSLAAATSIPTAGEALSKLVENCDVSGSIDAVGLRANATTFAAAQAAAAAAAGQSLPLTIPVSAVTAAPGLTTGAAAVSLRVRGTAPAGAPPVLKDPEPAAVHATNDNGDAAAANALSEESCSGPGLSAAHAHTGAGLLAGFFAPAASNMQVKGGGASQRRSGRASRLPTRPGVLMLAPAPTHLACPSCVPELPTEAFGVEVHQVGKFLVKGHTGPVEIVEVLLSHLSARRQLLGDNIPKAQKGCCMQLQTARVAAVEAVQLPGVARLYRQQHEQQLTAAAAANAGAAQQALSDSLSLTGIQRRSLQQLSTVQRTSSLIASILGSSSHSLSVAGSGDSAHTINSRKPSEPQQKQQPGSSLLPSLQVAAEAVEGGGDGGCVGVSQNGAADIEPADHVAATQAASGTLELPAMRSQRQKGVEPADDAV